MGGSPRAFRGLASGLALAVRPAGLGKAHGSGGRWPVGLLAAPTARQCSAWSTSGPWSPVADELQPLVIASCCFVPKPHLSCDSASQQFASLHGVFGPHVP
jgi:hypothetical protein